jgi:futalosine hydrolase
MSDVADCLLVAATAAELPPVAGGRTLVCGVGPVDAAVRTAAALALLRPRLLLHIGIAGARRDAALPIGTLVLGAESVYDDLAVPARFAPRALAPDPALLAAARLALPHARALPIGTSGRVGGTAASPVEAMEGFAVLRAAALAGVPALELRAISNVVEEADRTRWDIPAALRALHLAIPQVLPALAAATDAPPR